MIGQLYIIIHLVYPNANIFQSMVTPLKSNKTDNYRPTNCWQSNSDDLI